MRPPSALLGLLCALGPAAHADVATLGPSKDNTLYESSGGFKSNGAGSYCFAGKTNLDELRRGLLEFDLEAEVPPGSTVTAVELRIYVSKTSSSILKPLSLHRALAEWGEGPSMASGEEGAGGPVLPGDASWTKRVHPDLAWTAVGGDFEAVASSTIGVGDVGAYTFTSAPALVADVQAWVDDPSQNHGWVAIGREIGGDSAKRYNSREHPDPNLRPRLTVFFDPPACATQVAASESLRLGQPANPAAFLPGLSGGPVVGSTWDPVIDHTSFAPDAVLDLVAVGATPINLALPGLGTLLCDVSAALSFEAPGPGLPFALAIPADCALVGVSLVVQGGSLTAGGGLVLANALDVVIGSS